MSCCEKCATFFIEGSLNRDCWLSRENSNNFLTWQMLLSPLLVSFLIGTRNHSMSFGPTYERIKVNTPQALSIISASLRWMNKNSWGFFPITDPGADDTIFHLDGAALLDVVLLTDGSHVVRWRGQGYPLQVDGD